MGVDTLARAIDSRAFVTSSRRAAVDVYRYLRDLILTGTIPPETILSQLELAKLLGVSRTPVREAVRMLQKEGIVDAAPDRRAKVAGFDPVELDAAYAARLSVECVAVSMTVPRLDDGDIDRLKATVGELLSPECRGNLSSWRRVHASFHAITTQYASPAFQEILNAHVTRCGRYVMLYQLRHQSNWWLRGENEHREIAEACVAKDATAAVRCVARHLARTALDLVAELAPEVEPYQTRAALRQLTGEARR
jgi:DNA-binding GntR family transcriptional regulator